MPYFRTPMSQIRKIEPTNSHTRHRLASSRMASQRNGLISSHWRCDPVLDHLKRVGLKNRGNGFRAAPDSSQECGTCALARAIKAAAISHCQRTEKKKEEGGQPIGPIV